MSSNDTTAMQQLPVKCTLKRCGKMFATEKEMKSHKYHDPDHYYCRKCDYDAKDWDDMLDHKVASMAPFIIGEKRHDKYKKMKHLCCEYCGEDFKSMEGRMDHRREAHQAAQYIQCQGCGPVFDEETQQIVTATCTAVFMRPSHLIEHFEKGKCRFITADEFHAERQHKHIIKQILADADVFSGIISASKAMVHNSEWDDNDSSINDAASNGGVGLLDDDSSSAEADAYETLVPRLERQNLMDQDINDPTNPAKLHTMNYTAWPLPGAQALPRSMFKRASTKSTNSQAEIAAEAGSPPPLVDNDARSDSGSEHSASTVRDQTDTNNPSRAVSIAPSQASLASYISDLHMEPVSIDWAAVARTRAINASLANNNTSTLNSSNLFTARWYDPSSPSYNPDLFWHTILEVYKCPFASCGTELESQSEMESHLRHNHVISKNKCPTCFKEFHQVSGLVRHFEASVRGSRCWIAGTRQFAQVLCEVTGGFLDAFDVSKKSGENQLAGYVKTREGVVKVEGQVGAQGIVTKRFEGTRPEGLEGRKLEEKGLAGENEWRKIRGSRVHEGWIS
ncbi:hypothetical protein BDZ85DRAFT_279352 [Elsinoe ampelina]|uniref:C2H2-type domain-containing protein n=1 Tax=Elsinoe ampelina TaxID=302913 RepID=A0A6A6GJ86_9PEZI|nr:hypothetical protein BDZ85DRAFT_279352 [Elsinoe ampelina]